MLTFSFIKVHLEEQEGDKDKVSANEADNNKTAYEDDTSQISKGAETTTCKLKVYTLCAHNS